MERVTLGDPTLSMIDLTNHKLPKEMYKACATNTVLSYSPYAINQLECRVSPSLHISPLEAQHLLVSVRVQQEVLKRLETSLVEQLDNFK